MRVLLHMYVIFFSLGLDVGEWHSQSDGARLRDLSYTLALNYSFGPKFSHTTDHQMYSKLGQPGLKHIVDTEVQRHCCMASSVGLKCGRGLHS